MWCWRRLLRVPWTARRPNQSILKEISPQYSLEGLMLKLKLQYFGHLMWRTDSLEKTLMLGKIEGGRRKNSWKASRILLPLAWLQVRVKLIPRSTSWALFWSPGQGRWLSEQNDIEKGRRDPAPGLFPLWQMQKQLQPPISLFRTPALRGIQNQTSLGRLSVPWPCCCLWGFLERT